MPLHSTLSCGSARANASERRAMRTYVALSLITSASALAAAPTTARPKAPLPFTSPKKVDEALRKNDPLLHLASRLIRDVNARRGVRSVYAWCRRADDVADEAGVTEEELYTQMEEMFEEFYAQLRMMSRLSGIPPPPRELAKMMMMRCVSQERGARATRRARATRAHRQPIKKTIPDIGVRKKNSKHRWARLVHRPKNRK